MSGEVVVDSIDFSVAEGSPVFLPNGGISKERGGCGVEKRLVGLQRGSVFNKAEGRAAA